MHLVVMVLLLSFNQGWSFILFLSFMTLTLGRVLTNFLLKDPQFGFDQCFHVINAFWGKTTQ